jgi:hypothetical protein
MQANGPGPMPANSTMRKPASGPEATFVDVRESGVCGILFFHMAGREYGNS